MSSKETNSLEHLNLKLVLRIDEHVDGIVEEAPFSFFSSFLEHHNSLPVMALIPVQIDIKYPQNESRAYVLHDITM